jgi:hypothetical protein
VSFHFIQSAQKLLEELVERELIETLNLVLFSLGTLADFLA